MATRHFNFFLYIYTVEGVQHKKKKKNYRIVTIANMLVIYLATYLYEQKSASITFF